MNKFLHKSGQTFAVHAEFTDDRGRKITLLKSLYNIRRSAFDTTVDFIYETSGQWFIGYGHADDEYEEMGVCHVYDKFTRKNSNPFKIFVQLTHDMGDVEFGRLKVANSETES